MLQIKYGSEGAIFLVSGENCWNKTTFVLFTYHDDTFS